MTCTEDRTVYDRAYRLRTGRPVSADLGVVRAHLALLREAGITAALLSEMTGLSYVALHRLAAGKASRVTNRVAATVLAVAPADAPDRALVPVERLDVILAALSDLGICANAVGVRIGMARSPRDPRAKTVSVGRVRACQAVLDSERKQRAGELADRDALRAEWRRRTVESRERRGVARKVEPSDLTWQDRARCKTMGHDVFFAEGDRRAVARAQAICAACDVAGECEAFARRERMSGVWGGVVMTGGRRARKRGAA